MTSNKATRKTPSTAETGAVRHYASELHLHTDEWIVDPYICEHPVKLTFAADKPNAGSGKVTIVVEARGESIPALVDADRPVTMATDDEVAYEAKRAERSAVVDGLIELANLLGDERLPIKGYLGSLSLHSGLTRAELLAVGSALGIEPKRSYGSTFEVERRPTGVSEYGPGIRASWMAKYPACPFVFVPGEGGAEGSWVEDVPEGVDGVIPCKFEQGHDEPHVGPVKR